MRNATMLIRLIVVSAWLVSAAAWADVEYNDSTQMSYRLAGAGKLIVDNITGGIRVTSHAARDVRILVREHWTADSQERLAEGRKAVKLDASQDSGNIRLYVNGPFRCCCDCGFRFHGDPG